MYPWNAIFLLKIDEKKPKQLKTHTAKSNGKREFHLNFVYLIWLKHII